MSMSQKIILLLTAVLLLYGCTAQPFDTTSPSAMPTTALPTEPTTQPTTLPPDPLEELVNSMTMEELVGQMLLVRCPEGDVEAVLQTYQFGGLVLFSRDFSGENPESMVEKLNSYQDSVNIPLLISVDEEGGSVTRVSSYKAFRDSKFPSPRRAYRTGGLSYLLEVEAEKAELLNSLGINVNLAPVCDVVTDSDAFLYSRSLGLSAEETASCIAAMVQTAGEYGVGSVLKHFPGYGNCEDTHIGTALDDRSLEDFRTVDFLPFLAGFEAGAGGVMVCHNIVTCMDADHPASLSPEAHRILREELGFEGVIITDDMAMDAIADVYGEGEAAVLAVLAGNDMLCTSGYEVQFEAILAAVSEGRISESQLQESVLRILRWKAELGLI